jgi:hypothetical protein
MKSGGKELLRLDLLTAVTRILRPPHLTDTQRASLLQVNYIVNQPIPTPFQTELLCNYLVTKRSSLLQALWPLRGLISLTELRRARGFGRIMLLLSEKPGAKEQGIVRQCQRWMAFIGRLIQVAHPAYKGMPKIEQICPYKEIITMQGSFRWHTRLVPTLW